MVYIVVCQFCTRTCFRNLGDDAQHQGLGVEIGMHVFSLDGAELFVIHAATHSRACCSVLS